MLHIRAAMFPGKRGGPTPHTVPVLWPQPSMQATGPAHWATGPWGPNGKPQKISRCGPLALPSGAVAPWPAACQLAHAHHGPHLCQIAPFQPFVWPTNGPNACCATLGNFIWSFHEIKPAWLF